MAFATKCWNCGSSNFKETVSREYCPDCGIECNYHGDGANDKYHRAASRQQEIARRKQRERFARDEGMAYEELWDD